MVPRSEIDPWWPDNLPSLFGTITTERGTDPETLEAWSAWQRERAPLSQLRRLEEWKGGLTEAQRRSIEGGVVRIIMDPEAVDELGRQIPDAYMLKLTDYGRSISQEMRDRIAAGTSGTDSAGTIKLFTEGLSPEHRDLVEQRILTVTVDPDTGVPYLIKGAMAQLLPEEQLNAILAQTLGLPPGAPPGLTPAEAAALRLEEASLLGRLDGASTLERERFEQDRDLRRAALLGQVLVDGQLRETLDRQRLGVQEQDIAQRGDIAREGYAVDRERLALEQLLGEMGMGLRGDELALQRMLGMGGLDVDRGALALDAELGRGSLAEQVLAREQAYQLDRERLGLDQKRFGLERAGLMGFMGGVPTLETGMALGEIGGRPTLDAKQLALNKAALEAEWIRNPSNFIVAQLLRGGPGTTVGLNIPGRIAETLYGGKLPNPSQLGYGTFGPGQLKVPSLQTLNQLNEDELRAVAAAAPFVTGGMVTPTQYFGDAAYQGLRAF